MPISPRCGSTWWMRQRKSCASSVEVGALKPVTRTLIGLRTPRQCLTVPSLPEASMPCSTTRTERLRSAISIVASSAIRSRRFAVRARAPSSLRRPNFASGGWSPRSTLEPGTTRVARARSCIALTIRETGQGVLRERARRARCGCRRDRRRIRASRRAGRRRAASRSRPRSSAASSAASVAASRTAQRGVRLRGRREGIAHADVQLLRRRTGTSSRRVRRAPRASRARARPSRSP